MRRRYRQDAPPDDVNWLITYGDMMTLLLAFFIFLFSMASADDALIKAVMSVVTDTREGSGIEADSGPIAEIRKAVEMRGLAADVQIIVERGEARLLGSDSVFFEPGSANIHPNAAILLKAVAAAIKQTVYEVRVEGHADDSAGTGGKYASNWELSTARASSVARFFEREGIAPDRLSVAGYAQFRPRYPPTPENRAQNRRVEIVLVRK
ncbi:MAG: flagellar motor protein MotB [Nitrospirae bacterium]|nr:flagellar motor protein MotB [Nitrospirota bacterium]